MRTRPIFVLFATAVLMGGPLAVAATADPPPLPTETGCPVGQELTLAYLSQWPYVLPFRLDVEGNNDGIVCGVPLPPAILERCCPEALVPVIYQFRDNDIPAARHG
jgi:hypothetical protein